MSKETGSKHNSKTQLPARHQPGFYWFQVCGGEHMIRTHAVTWTGLADRSRAEIRKLRADSVTQTSLP